MGMPNPEGQAGPAEKDLGRRRLRIDSRRSKTNKNRTLGVRSTRAVAQTRRLPFDRLRANGGVLKSFEFPVHAELVEA
jgi:hypothetical protein